MVWEMWAIAISIVVSFGTLAVFMGVFIASCPFGTVWDNIHSFLVVLYLMGRWEARQEASRSMAILGKLTWLHSSVFDAWWDCDY